MCPGVRLFRIIIFGIFFWMWMPISFSRLGRFPAIISSGNCSSLFSFSFPFGTPILQTLFQLVVSRKSHKLSFFFFLPCLGEFLCPLFEFIDSSFSLNLMLNTYCVIFSSVIVLLNSVTSACQLLIFSVSVEVFTMVIHSSPKFGKHLYDNLFELFIRYTYLCFIKFF